MSINSRGRIDYRDLVHYEHPESGGRLMSGEPLCRNGSYHIRYTRVKRYVTCTYCLDLLKKQGD